MSSNVHQSSMGVLNLRGAEKKFQLTRHTPSEEVGFFVKHFWVVSWDLTGQEPYSQDVIPNPCVNLIIENNRTGIFGASTDKYSHSLKEKGLVFGAKFKPGGFYPFIKRPVSQLMNNPMNVKDIFDIDASTLEKMILSQEEEGTMVELAERFIQQKLPERDSNIILVNQVIDRIIEDQEITKVDHICQRFKMNKRKLQRLFDQYVGVSPKWVIKLYRLQHAAGQMDTDHNHDWLKLSMDLGYYDQSHFIKDFKTIIGKTPDEYVRQQVRSLSGLQPQQ
ncbi:AraC family transcriptional regulator [Paenibacillus baekrokdamisoli]|uniref:AraC family transcriptional regulator n=1 Tax=Paenibacillus baekrokdamisoli TaxID=1712516 RepID=A0A3G9IVX8_9BACL|nr:AraC family transcriptional regulator [Paenibacillus baekrokdamisoli]MBB3067917.1 AraC-like DNA-binding protein [Paenibacillus baekrokdamisoli]BBH23037.1 AraC family transcriptional regulator [Paenibacillus baekrokdamisoli]